MDGIKINGERLLADLRAMRAMGAAGTGVVRPAFSEIDMTARRWLAERYTEAGLTATIDGVGNVLGKSANPGPALLIGSHSDTQPTGGWLDGALGVAYGLEVVRALAEDPATKHLAVDAVSWQDEESRFYGCLGSRSFCGGFPAEAEQGLTDKDGVALSDALAQAGLTDVPRLSSGEHDYMGFLEAHIEQGPHLETDGLRIGIVESIVGLGGMVFTFTGQQNHAGTTMMAGRKDAATALYALANAINEEFPKVAGERSVWTMGRVLLRPGAPSIVPGYAELELQYRDVDPAVLDRFEATAHDLVARINGRGGAVAEAKPSRVRIAPAHMDEGFRGHLAKAAERHAPGNWTAMPSGAFHDAGVVCAVMPCAMLFIPSIGGISHDFAEDSHVEDIILGCEVLATGAAAILTAAV
ncbi:MAG: hydantoinase/carbamoylase family amidase [Rhodospirillaceae bacterium]|jgi:N-carbamoyl-L-amino-acid hydrolase|nr:hydantoinase/carbamoylase family amidase [Rhodospirillaceae bacterium]MBT3494184.1 hydantoinase/carbamoylase family amidase [Rhodospirillaceae bacterium]MBT3781502.1 hydantoinase/carbamoylase family amidase [Rhodospirillaceae bacterium]MBT3979275.1 hydantoinase/carbamoylase family amidase [Rhodospirillaceae bacterium]MBT4564422.1 hydantoinase/carbamoylase family amidase [Rhodospirillaceae bacterium]